MGRWEAESRHGKTQAAARLMPAFALVLLMAGTASPGTEWTGNGPLDDEVPEGFPMILSSKLVRLTDDDWSQFDPAISGDIVVFTESTSTQSISYVNLSAGEKVKITTEEAHQRLNDVGGKWIVYTDYEESMSNVMIHDIETGEARLATDAFGVQEWPRVDGDLLTFVHKDFDHRQVWVMDLSTDKVIKLGDDAPNVGRPVVDGSRVAYEHREGGGVTHVALHELDTGEGRAVAPRSSDLQVRPDVNGDLLVFDANPPGEMKRDLFIHHVSTKDTVRLDLPGDQTRGRISGGFVTYDDENTDDIGLLHVPTCTLHNVTDDPETRDWLADIEGNRVVYTSDRSGSLDIWLYEFETPPGSELLGQGNPSLCPLVDDRFKAV